MFLWRVFKFQHGIFVSGVDSLANCLRWLNDAGCKSREISYSFFFNGITHTHTRATHSRLALLDACPVRSSYSSHSQSHSHYVLCLSLRLCQCLFGHHNERERERELLGLLWLSHFNVYANMRATPRFLRPVGTCPFHVATADVDVALLPLPLPFLLLLLLLADMSKCWPNTEQHSRAAI